MRRMLINFDYVNSMSNDDYDERLRMFLRQKQLSKVDASLQLHKKQCCCCAKVYPVLSEKKSRSVSSSENLLLLTVESRRRPLHFC